MPPGSNAFLLLRGLGREQRHWGSFPQELSRAFHEAPVYCLDLPGAGTESYRKSPIHMDAIVSDVRERWLKLPKADTYHCVAISLGGMVALNWCRLFPNDFASLTLINSSMAGLSPFWRRLRPERYPQLFKSFFMRDPKGRERLVLDMTTRVINEQQKNEIANGYASFYKTAPLQRSNFLRQLLAALKFHQSGAPEKPIKKTILVSRNDPFTHSSCSQALADFLGASIYWNEIAGHDLPIDDPKWLVESLLRELSY